MTNSEAYDFCELLVESVKENFEQLVFIFAYSSDYPVDEPWEKPCVTARAYFFGPVEGMISVSVSEDILLNLTCNMLGLDQDDSLNLRREEKHDAFMELLNIISGNFLPKAFGVKAIFDIGKLVVSEEVCNGDFYEGMSRKCSARLDIEDDRCDIFLFLK